MKNSYKLLGLVWDRKSDPGCLPRTTSFDPFLVDAGYPMTLFDLHGIKRKISITRLFSVESEEGLSSVVKDLRECDEVYVWLDFMPCLAGAVMQEFYWHRVRQACYWLKNSLPNTKIRLMLPRERRGAA